MNNRDQFIPPINKYTSRRTWEDACWKKILREGDLLEIITTPGERHNLVMRAAALDRLKLGKSYNQIGQELWLSPQTISCIKKSLKENGYRSYSERSKKERKPKNYSPSEEPRPYGRGFSRLL